MLLIVLSVCEALLLIQMSVNRVLKKRREAQQASETQDSTEPMPGQSPQQPHSQQQSQYDPEREKQFEQYADYAQYNPASFEFSNSYMPHSLNLYNRYKFPLSCYINPINSALQYTEQPGAGIPRCASCRAYMNYYNEASRKGFKCFFCGRDNPYEFEYDPEGNGVQLTNPSYLVDGPTGVYNASPPEPTFIFLVDVSKQAQQCRMLSYMISAMKAVLVREDLNDTVIYFYTFDDTVHEYNFAGEEAERTVLDPSIKSEGARPSEYYLVDIREKLFALLDGLEELAERNPRMNSRFYEVLGHVYEGVKHTGGKLFVFQANEAIAGQNFMNENFKWTTAPQDNVKIKSVLQTKNKVFFNRFVQPMLVENISAAFFVFARGRKNIRTLSDTCKLTNSQLLYYSKEGEEGVKFYYELYHLLGATYYTDTRIQFIISSGWYYTAVYGNIYRLKENITFKVCHFEDSKRICAVFLPQDGFNPSPHFALQIVTNYLFGRKHYLSVNTAVLPFTTSIDRLFENMHMHITASTFFKVYLSSLRLQDVVSCRQKYIRQAASLWKAASDYYKGNFTPQIRAFLLSLLAFLKNHHSQIDLIADSPLLERVISQRNILQSCDYPECNTTFSPYLFDLTSVGNDRCLEDNFLYPDACELRFASVKEGVFLLDAGNALYLYLARQFHPNYSLALFGKDKLAKGERLDEELIVEQDNQFSRQVQQLVRVLRESKTYGWAPLYVVRCGENTENERNFYLNFYEEKYEEYRTHKLSYEEFIQMLAKTNP